MDEQNLRGKRTDGDDDDFYCAKSRNDVSFLWDDDGVNEMKGKTVHLKLSTINLLEYFSKLNSSRRRWENNHVSGRRVSSVNKLLSKITQNHIINI